MPDQPSIPEAPATPASDPQATAGHPCQPPFYVVGDYGPGDSVGYLMRGIMRTFVNEIDRRLETVGLTNAQWGPLFTIHKLKSTTLAELSRELQTDPGALTRTLDRLEAKGLCTRERSTEDRRVVNLALTPEGEAATAPVPAVLCEVMNAYLAGFTHDEWQTLLDFLRRMQVNAQAMHEQTHPPEHR